jgi:hypothetical protein
VALLFCIKGKYEQLVSFYENNLTDDQRKDVELNNIMAHAYFQAGDMQKALSLKRMRF